MEKQLCAPLPVRCRNKIFGICSEFCFSERFILNAPHPFPPSPFAHFSKQSQAPHRIEKWLLRLGSWHLWQRETMFSFFHLEFPNGVNYPRPSCWLENGRQKCRHSCAQNWWSTRINLLGTLHRRRSHTGIRQNVQKNRQQNNNNAKHSHGHTTPLCGCVGACVWYDKHSLKPWKRSLAWCSAFSISLLSVHTIPCLSCNSNYLTQRYQFTRNVNVGPSGTFSCGEFAGGFREAPLGLDAPTEKWLLTGPAV